MTDHELLETIEDAADEYYRKNFKQPTHLILNMPAWHKICDIASSQGGWSINDEPRISVYNSFGGSRLIVSILAHSTLGKDSTYHVIVAG